MNKHVIYRATHNTKGKVYEGTASEIAARIKVYKSTIYKITSSKVVGGCWLVERISELSESETTYRFPQDLIDDWNRTTKPFKAASRKGKKNARVL